MKRVLLWSAFSITVLALLLVGSVVAQVRPTIKANGSDGPVTVFPLDTLSITVALDNVGNTDNADWWLAANTPYGVYFYTHPDWIDLQQPAYQGPLTSFNSLEILNTYGSVLPPGTYTFFFGVDTVMDGKITMGNAYYDFVEVNVVQ